jgi:hypothetical protein
MSGRDHRRDFSARRGCVWALIFVFAILVAVLVLIAQHRTPFHTGSHVTPAIVPGQER